MPFTLTMPKMSPTMEEGTIATWHKKEGDFVEADELLFEVATDKATVEYNALDEGYLRKILVNSGEEARVNQAVAIFTEEKSESIEGYEPEGEKVEEAPVEEEALQQETAAKPKTTASHSDSATMKQPAFVPEAPLEDYEFSAARGDASDRVLASPLAKKLAKERGLDLSSVKGSGPGKRIVAEDLERAKPLSRSGIGTREVPKLAPGTFVEHGLTPMRKVISQRLQEAKTFIPHFYVTQVLDAEPMMRLRNELKEYGVKVTFNDFVLRACALALREHPVVNSGFNTVNQTIVEYQTVDIAMAVTVDGGLITPIIRHCDFKDIQEISAEARSLAGKARDGKLQAHEYKGGSFTVSNLGMFGISDFQAVINPPHGAILAVSGIEEKAVVKDGQVVPGQTMSISLSSDHRVIDGVVAAQFIKTVQKFLEHPAGLIL
ncbi:MAG: pyruvate dehydrogenase complex dihydrolipoamide acetyltransferase [Waddliaceae bacterium]|nr:pyruvate dehydrogenase complex dihydrolipoamide acetyltransferase [Waddliaceae bacterium]